MAPIVGNHFLQTGSEPAASGPDVLWQHRAPGWLDGWWQRPHIQMRSSASLLGNVGPNAVVQGVQVWAVWRPDVVWPKLDVIVLKPLLCLLGCVAQGTILHQHVIGFQAVCIFNPGFDFAFEGLNVLVRVNPGPNREEVWSQPSCCHRRWSSRFWHHTSQMFCRELKPDVVINILWLFRA